MAKISPHKHRAFIFEFGLNQKIPRTFRAQSILLPRNVASHIIMYSPRAQPAPLEVVLLHYNATARFRMISRLNHASMSLHWTWPFSAGCRNLEGHSLLALYTAAPFVHVFVALVAGLALCYGESINLTWPC